MTLRIILLSGLTLFAASIAVSAEGETAAISVHPENQHYFQWRSKPTILVTSGERYGALLNLDFDYVRYFDELKAHGLNHTRVFAGTYRENVGAFGITENVLAPKPGRYISPWARSSQPGYAVGGHKFDLTKWDPAWFKRVKDLLQQASVRAVEPKLTTYALAEPGKAYAMYFHVPLPSKPKVLQSLLRDDIEALATLNLPAGKWRAEWLDTKTGETIKHESFQHDGGDRRVKLPEFSNDIALRLIRQD